MLFISVAKEEIFDYHPLVNVNPLSHPRSQRDEAAPDVRRDRRKAIVEKENFCFLGNVHFWHASVLFGESHLLFLNVLFESFSKERIKR